MGFDRADGSGLASRALAATDAQCTEILQHALEARNPETRQQAVAALSLASGSGPLFDQLERMLRDKDVQVRQAVVASLADVKSERGTAALKKALEDAVPEVSFAAAKALWARHDSIGRDALLAILAKESKTSSNFFSKQKRDGLRMMHTPRTTLLFAAEQGIGFVPLPGPGRRRRFHAGDPRQFGSPGTRIGGFAAGGRPGSRHHRGAPRRALRQGCGGSGRRGAFHQSAQPTCLEERTGAAVAGRQRVRAPARGRGLLRLSAIENGARTKERSTAALAPGAQKRKK